MSLIKLFNNQFMEFLDDVNNVYPRDANIKAARFFIENIIKLNPSLLIKLWYRDVGQIYKEEVEQGDLSFFLHKNYNSDVKDREEPETIIQTINIIKKLVSDLTNNNKKK